MARARLARDRGDAAAAARAVLETGEYDYAWNTQLAPDVIAGMEQMGRGKVSAAFGSLVERIHVNLTDPSSSHPEGERSTNAHPHPFLTDPAVRKALSMAIDRQLLTEIGYGAAGQPTCNYVPAPEAWASTMDEHEAWRQKASDQTKTFATNLQRDAARFERLVATEFEADVRVEAKQEAERKQPMAA